MAQLRIAREKIKKLKQENIILSRDADTAFQDGLNEAQDLYAEQVKTEVKSEAIKEFARKLENALDKRLGDDIPIFGDRDNVYCTVSDIYNVIDNLEKEMTEVEK